eukprot:UN02234
MKRCNFSNGIKTFCHQFGQIKCRMKIDETVSKEAKYIIHKKDKQSCK